MFAFLLSYTGLVIIFAFIALAYTISHYIFNFLYPSHSLQPAAETPRKKTLEFRESPIMITEEAQLMNIEEAELGVLNKPNPNIYMIIGFYETLNNETLDLHEKNISTLMHYHMKKNYFHELFRIEKSQASLFDKELQNILKEIESSTNKKESIHKIYSLFKSPRYKRQHYEMDEPEPSSLFSHINR